MTDRRKAIAVTADAHRPIFMFMGAAIVAAFLMGVAMVKAEQEFKRQDLAAQEQTKW